MFPGAERLLQDPGECEWNLQKHQCTWGEACGRMAWSPTQQGNGGWNVTLLLLSKKRESRNDHDVDVLDFITIFSLAWRWEKASNSLRIFLFNRKNKQVEKKKPPFFFSCLSALFLLSWKAVTCLLSMKPDTLGSSNKSGRQRTAAQKSWRRPVL